MTANTLSGVVISAIASIATALIAVVITYILTRRREHESDWRKLKLAQYEEYIRAHSGVIEGRATPEAHRRYADAVNSLALVAPISVLAALQAYQIENSYVIKHRTNGRLDELLDTLIRAMCRDVHPSAPQDPTDFVFKPWAPPPVNNDGLSVGHSQRK